MIGNGPIVRVVRTLATGDTVVELLHASEAVRMVLDDPLNGGEVVSARIEWGRLDARAWDTSHVPTTLV